MIDILHSHFEISSWFEMFLIEARVFDSKIFDGRDWIVPNPAISLQFLDSIRELALHPSTFCKPETSPASFRTRITPESFVALLESRNEDQQHWLRFRRLFGQGARD